MSTKINNTLKWTWLFFSESDSDSEISSSGPGGCSVDDTVLLSEQHVEGSSSLGKCHLIQEIDTAK